MHMLFLKRVITFYNSSSYTKSRPSLTKLSLDILNLQSNMAQAIFVLSLIASLSWAFAAPSTQIIGGEEAAVSFSSNQLMWYNYAE